MTEMTNPGKSDILIFQTEDGETKISVLLDGKTVWLTQAGIAELYQTSPQNITMHVKTIYSEQELEEISTCKDYLQVRTEGSRQIERNLKHYSLDMILAVGYRVHSHRGTQFRRWATRHLREYLVKGFVLDDERLKEGRNLGADYFGELLERIRDIRASEKRFYKKITDIYSTAVDYEPNAQISKTFFAMVQNKLHWAIHGHTAAEVIAGRVDADKPNMGLTTWKGAKVRKADVNIAKNYLSENELRSLNRIVTMYLDYAEDQAERQRPMYMRDWAERLNGFLQFNKREALQDAGKVSAEVAKALAEEEYAKFNQRRLTAAVDEEDDFDRAVKHLKAKNLEDQGGNSNE